MGVAVRVGVGCGVGEEVNVGVSDCVGVGGAWVNRDLAGCGTGAAWIGTAQLVHAMSRNNQNTTPCFDMNLYYWLIDHRIKGVYRVTRQGFSSANEEVKRRQAIIALKSPAKDPWHLISFS